MQDVSNECERCRAELMAMVERGDLITLTEALEIRRTETSVEPAWRAHLDQCPDCCGVLREQLDALCLLAEPLAPLAPSDSLRRRVIEHAQPLDEPPRPIVAPAPESYSSPNIASYVVAATVFLLVTAGIMAWYYPAGSQVSVSQMTDAEKRAFLADVQQQFGHPGVVYVTLEPQTASRSRAWIIYDPVAGEAHFYCEQLPKLTMPMHYRVWCLAGDNVISSAVLGKNSDSSSEPVSTNTSATGACTLAVKQPGTGDRDDAGDRVPRITEVSIVLTVESDTAVARPQGPVQMTALVPVDDSASGQE